MIRGRVAILVLLTGLNLLNYIDRAVIAAVVKPMRAELGLSSFEAGLLNSAFLIGYFLTSPLFGAHADKFPRKRMIALGVVVWSLATVASGIGTGFWSLLIARAVVGVGEASYAVLAPTIIDDLTPPDRKGKALAVFYLAIPAGYALGYILGGFLSNRLGWREAFLITGGPGVVLAVSCLFIVEPPRKLLHAKARLLSGLRELTQIPLFRRTVIGYTLWTAAAGAFAYWAPSYLVERFPKQLNDETANLWFGLVLIVAGAIGTVIGGRWLDRGLRGMPAPAPGAPWDATAHKLAVNMALKVCAVGALFAAPLTVFAFLSPSPFGFFSLAFVIELGLFLSTSPVNAAVLRSVPIERRASAMAVSLFAIHLFGDLWSSALLGLMLDVARTSEVSIIVAMMALPIVFGWSGLVWWPRRREAR